MFSVIVWSDCSAACCLPARRSSSAWGRNEGAFRNVSNIARMASPGTSLRSDRHALVPSPGMATKVEPSNSRVARPFPKLAGEVRVKPFVDKNSESQGCETSLGRASSGAIPSVYPGFPPARKMGFVPSRPLVWLPLYGIIPERRTGYDLFGIP